jgi:tight adherence protein C
LKLPHELENGITVRWLKESNRPIAEISCLFLFCYLVIFLKRYDGLERELKAGKDAIISDFPDFIDKLVLLLNAGLVTDTALQKIAWDYQRFRDLKNVKPLYEGLLEMQKRILETNAPLSLELREFAQKSGVRELTRFATIVEDNLNKGSTLTEKLEGEGALLWLSKKKRAEEKGRLAETKLIFPLMLLLLVLILITTGPVMLGI